MTEREDRLKFKPQDLSDTQMILLMLIASGLTNNEIAGEMGFSESTIKHYIRDLKDHFRVDSRGELSALYYNRYME